MPSMIEYAQYCINKVFDGILTESELKKVRIDKGDRKTFDRERDCFQSFRLEEQEFALPHIKWGACRAKIPETEGQDATSFLVFTGLRFSESEYKELSSYGIEPVVLNTGLALRVIKEFKVPISSHVTLLEIEENLSSQHLDEGYTGHDFQELIDCFDEITVLKISENSAVLRHSKSAQAYFALSFSNALVRLPFDELLVSFKNLIIDIPYLPPDSIFKSFTSSHWKHSYLELYRCIEAIYLLPKAKQLKAELQADGSVLDFAEKVEYHLGWRPREIDSLKSLISVVPNETLEHAVSEGFIDEPEQSEQERSHKLIEKISLRVYELRNGLVHYRIRRQNLTDETELWRMSVNYLMMMLRDIYMHFSQDLDE
ncbi:hypothetical protein [Marinobacter sp. MIT932201]|uniref:hypothetical protein n=1 Tax=Marinobacter sp. MIT932201 TaxID=3096995 RepID=UPI00399A2D3F